MEQSSLVGPGFSKTPIPAIRQTTLVDAALSNLHASSAFRESYEILGHGLNGALGLLIRLDVVDARMGLLSCHIFRQPPTQRLHKPGEVDFDWLEWVKAIGIPPTDANFQHNVRLQAKPLLTAETIDGFSCSREQLKFTRLLLDPINRYGYLGRHEDLDIQLAAMYTPLELLVFRQFRL